MIITVVIGFISICSNICVVNVLCRIGLSDLFTWHIFKKNSINSVFFSFILFYNNIQVGAVVYVCYYPGNLGFPLCFVSGHPQE